MRLIASAALMLLCYTSCKQTDSPVTREDELRSGQWKMTTAFKKIAPAIGTPSLTSILSGESCRLDDYLEFKTNFAATQNSAGKCDPSDPDIIDFRWQLTNNSEGITLWNANQTFFGRSTVDASFLYYSNAYFTIKYVEFQPNASDPTKKDTVTYTHSFVKM